MTSDADVTGSITFGVLFILIGTLVLLNEYDVISLSWGYILPIVLIAAGLSVIVSSQVRSRSRRDGG